MNNRLSNGVLYIGNVGREYSCSVIVDGKQVFFEVSAFLGCCGIAYVHHVEFPEECDREAVYQGLTAVLRKKPVVEPYEGKELSKLLNCNVLLITDAEYGEEGGEYPCIYEMCQQKSAWKAVISPTYNSNSGNDIMMWMLNKS